MVGVLLICQIVAFISDMKFGNDAQQKFSYCFNLLSVYLNLFTIYFSKCLIQNSKLENNDFLVYTDFLAFISNLQGYIFW